MTATLPWDAPPVSSADAMRYDSPVPAAVYAPFPAVATNPATGQQIGMDLGPQLRAAIDTAISSAVAQHPVLGTAARILPERDRADRTTMQNSVIDIVLASIAMLFTIVAPDSPAVGVLWIAVAALASKTLLGAAIARFRPGAVP